MLTHSSQDRPIKSCDLDRTASTALLMVSESIASDKFSTSCFSFPRVFDCTLLTFSMSTPRTRNPEGEVRGIGRPDGVCQPADHSCSKLLSNELSVVCTVAPHHLAERHTVFWWTLLDLLKLHPDQQNINFDFSG